MRLDPKSTADVEAPAAASEQPELAIAWSAVWGMVKCRAVSWAKWGASAASSGRASSGGIMLPTGAALQIGHALFICLFHGRNETNHRAQP